jgi:hypothetical protein
MKLIDIIFESVIDMGEVHGQKLTDADFINRSKKIWGDRYDYGNVNYYGSHIPVKIKCLKHNNEFEQRPANHLNGSQGCKYCVEKPDRSLTLSDFVKKSHDVHGNKYDYDKVVMGKKNTHKVVITCPKHGDFLQSVASHLKGNGCKVCDLENRSLDTDEFIKKSKEKHGDKYDYSKVNYVNNKTPVHIICPIHGDFLQIPHRHLIGNECPKCGNSKKGQRSMTRDEFISRAKEKHGDKYSYDNVIMGKRVHDDKVWITCPKHGDFLQSPWNHINSAGCPVCLEPRGESKIRNILKSLNVDFSKEHVFDDCVNTTSGKKRCKKLQFDFYIPSKNIAIEYDGIQHFKPVKRFGGIEVFNTQKINDKIKDEYCEKMGIKLVRIPYTEFKNLEEILKTLLV